MRLVTRRTGLTAARIRMWERRYGVVTPGRSPGGQRLYSDRDIARLAHLARAAEAGHALPGLADLSDEALERLVAGERPGRKGGLESDPGLAARLVGYVEALDAIALEGELRRLAMAGGAAALSESVLGPLLATIGARWHEGQLTPAHEHLASASALRVLTWIGAQFPAGAGAPAVVVATPQGEQHELGAAMAAAFAAELGWRVVYLGRDLPAEDIAAAARQTGARVVALSLVNQTGREASGREALRVAELVGPDVRVAVGGAAAAALGPDTSGLLTVCGDLAALGAFLEEQAGRSPRGRGGG